jgi:hypothetical protein
MSGRVLMAPLDGKLPNLALMRIAAWERAQGAAVTWRHELPRHDLFTPDFDRVYGSAIFGTSTKAVSALRVAYPHAVIGGSGGDAALRVEQIVPSQFTELDYSGYPSFESSIGYAMRGCRFKCGFCVVPKQEGKARPEASIAAIWRGDPYPRHLHLLDNDFFGNPEWRDRVAEIVGGRFKVCINQGINVRLLDDEQAEAVTAMHPWDDQFGRGRLYCAWDNIGDERVFFDGIDRLEKAGWKPSWVFAYMLVGYDPRETWERLRHRFDRMVERGIRPYPMVHDRYRLERPEHWHRLKQFQRWVLRGTYKVAPFDEYDPSFKRIAA